MEGIGYWLFLAALYFLMSLMKKRQQKTARRMLDEDDSVQESDQQPGPFQSETLQELFNEIRILVRIFLNQGQMKSLIMNLKNQHTQMNNQK